MPPVPTPRKPETQTELFSLNVIRVETALSRFPVHRLAKRGNIAIEIREENENGEVLIKWKVSHNSEYGQPGPLAYKVETLIINRRVQEATRPIPEIIKLGSLSNLCRELGISGGKPRENVKNALYQNAGAFITAKVRYRQSDGTDRSIEIAGTRYNLIFTGEKLPNGETADAVYLVPHKFYREILNTAQVRPLDYDYLRDLSPASQRLYELLSFQMYAAIKHNRPRAKYAYSEFCTHAPQTRYLDFEQVKKQMYKVHAPHRKSGYIESVGLEQTIDRDGQPDWLMHYTPGPKAKAEYRALTKRGGGPQVFEIEQPSPALPPPLAEPTPLAQELINRSVTASTARELVTAYPEERIQRQIEAFDWLVEKKDRRVSKNPGGYLAESIRKDYAPPKGFESKADREKRREAEEAKRHQEQEEARRRRAEEARERAVQAKILAYWRDLSPDEQRRLEAEALEQADPKMREGYERQHPKLREIFLRSIRKIHIRKLLGLPPPLED